MQGTIARMGNGMLDLLYPPGLYCISCGKITDGSRTYHMCNDCMGAANWITERHCVRCGKPLSKTDPGEQCFACAAGEAGSSPHAFDKGYACAGYGAVERSAIFSFKYGGRSDLGSIFGEILYDRMTAEYSPDELACMYDMVIPVPIHTEKKKHRGFNHADLMAAAFAKRAGLRYEPDILIRARQTRPMKGLGPDERISNIAGAFEIRRRKLPLIERAKVLVVDDIFTTGATIDEIAALLKRSGASRVDFLAFAAAADYLIT